MTAWVRNLLMANVAMFLVTTSFPGAMQDLALIPALALARPWTLVTYMFLHSGLGHLFFNMLGLFFFGSRLEMRLGSARFLALYFISGLTAAVASMIFTPHAAVVGASGAIFGVMLGYARYWPRDLVYIWGVLPVQARWLVVAMTLLELYSAQSGFQAGVAHFAHLGGFVGGLFYLIWSDRHSPARHFRAQAAPPSPPGSSADLERWKHIRADGMHPVNRQELDRLLLKIASGQASTLTPEERAFLDRMSA
jgi:membrane associated rhomboid family serine protease